MPLLKADALALGYGSTTVAENISFSVNNGDYLCVVGENGSGKTTLIKTLIGLVKPISGNMEFGGGIKIGYLPQQTELQRDFPASVKEIVMSGFAGNGIFHPFYSKNEKETARRFAEKLGITKLWQQCYRELSGGQQHRVLLARALCASGNLLLLDEPAAALDPEAADEMYSLINSLNRDGTAVIMVTHDIEAALKYANRILKIGNEVFFGTKEDFINAANKTEESE